MRYSARKSESFDQRKGIAERGQRLARDLNLPIEDIRYAAYTFHNGRQWTVTCRWERNVDGHWIGVDWTDVSF